MEVVDIQQSHAVWWPTLALIAGVLIVLLLAFVMFLLLRRPKKRAAIAAPDLSINIAALDASGPPATGPRLEYYGTPVRLAVIVLAPAGRGSQVPPRQVLPKLFDYWVPGLAEVVSAHGPVVREWPEQLSSQGFTQAFSNNLKLPGDRGKGSPWCSVAGKFEFGGQQLLGGLVCCADGPNGLSQAVVQHEGLWHDVLRVREET